MPDMTSYMEFNNIERKVAETDFDPKEYEVLVKAARKSGLSIKEALRQAALYWARETSGIDPSDPIFHLKPVSYGDKKASQRIDEIVYGRRKRSS